MDREEASHLISEVDSDDHDGRVERLVELTILLPGDAMLGFSGQAAQWLFEDVKATWLYGSFTSTVLTAHAFCSLQLAGSIRWLPDNPALPEEPGSLEELAEVAVSEGVIGVDLQARLLDLNDRCRAYTAVHLHEYDPRLERHLVEASALTDEHPLLVDAREAMTTAVQLVYRRP
jgi:hypothetical protein